ncbi:MAG: DUF5056 domain-containing protein [Prevotellaceae bacterium]|jgi:hypothetical protein|nr:DUF5056 domain-containing protein [Prevotellaceae bacterium]
MKKDNITRFMQMHKQHIEDNGFTGKLTNQLKYYPQARKMVTTKSVVALIVPCCSLLAVCVVLLLGGWQIPFDTLLKAIASPNPLALMLCGLTTIALMFSLTLPIWIEDSL